MHVYRLKILYMISTSNHLRELTDAADDAVENYRLVLVLRRGHQLDRMHVEVYSQILRPHLEDESISAIFSKTMNQTLIQARPYYIVRPYKCDQQKKTLAFYL